MANKLITSITCIVLASAITGTPIVEVNTRATMLGFGPKKRDVLLVGTQRQVESAIRTNFNSIVAVGYAKLNESEKAETLMQKPFSFNMLGSLLYNFSHKYDNREGIIDYAKDERLAQAYLKGQIGNIMAGLKQQIRRELKNKGLGDNEINKEIDKITSGVEIDSIEISGDFEGYTCAMGDSQKSNMRLSQLRAADAHLRVKKTVRDLLYSQIAIPNYTNLTWNVHTKGNGSILNDPSVRKACDKINSLLGAGTVDYRMAGKDQDQFFNRFFYAMIRIRDAPKLSHEYQNILNMMSHLRKVDFKLNIKIKCSLKGIKITVIEKAPNDRITNPPDVVQQVRREQERRMEREFRYLAERQRPNANRVNMPRASKSTGGGGRSELPHY